MNKMKIEKVSISKIKVYENNAKIHSIEQIEQIKQSIEEFGNNDPIAIDENDMIIEGHGRFLALVDLGYEEVECIRLSHLTEEQKKAYILVHNQLTMNTGFDFDILNEELESIKNINMSDFDFRESDDLDLNEMFNFPFDDEEDEDEIEEDEGKEVLCPHCQEWVKI